MGFSAEKVAAELGITKGNYSHMENGKVEITLTRLNALAVIFKTPIDAFLNSAKPQVIQVSNGTNSTNINANIYHNNNPEIINAINKSLEILAKALEKA